MRVIIALVVALALSGLTLQAAYKVETQVGGHTAPWIQAGSWVIGSRATQRVTSVSAKASETGDTLSGFMVYQGEGPIGFKAQLTTEDSWIVQSNGIGSNYAWKQEGTWTFGGRAAQPLSKLMMYSSDNGASFIGLMTYKDESRVSFRAQLA